MRASFLLRPLLATVLLAAPLVMGRTGTAAGAAVGLEGASPASDRVDDPASEAATLHDEILRIIGASGVQGANWGVFAVSLERGDTLAAVAPDIPLTPASNQKLFTSAAALHHLGPDFRFPTYLLTEGNVEHGVLDGNLILYGTGDPAISGRLLEAPEAPFRAFARALTEQGIHAVSGDVIGDASFFDGPDRPPSWSRGYVDNWYAAPASALTFNENVVTLRIRPGIPGSSPRVQTIPRAPGISLANLAGTVEGASRRPLAVIRDDPRGPIEIVGDMRVGTRDVWREITVSDPAVYAASVLLRVLEEEGIRVNGQARAQAVDERSRISGSSLVAPAFAGSDPPLRTVAVHYSPPVHDLLGVINKVSHNLWSELLLLAMGRIGSGDGSFEGGSRVLTDYLVDVVGVPEADIRVADGSGLSRRNRATPSSFVRVLTHVASTDHADVFWAALPVAGNRSELGRMYGSPAAGNLRAKTGTIRRVSALSGIVTTANGEPVVFSIVSNGVRSSWAAKRSEDEIGIRLAALARPWMPETPELARVQAGEFVVSSPTLH